MNVSLSYIETEEEMIEVKDSMETAKVGGLSSLTITLFSKFVNIQDHFPCYIYIILINRSLVNKSAH